MTRRRYRFLRLAALLMIIIGVLGMLAGLVVGLIMVIRPSLILPAATTEAVLIGYRTSGGIIIASSLIGGLILAALGQYYQAFLELLEVNRQQVRGLKALVDK